MRLKELTFAFKNCYHHDRGISLITPLSTRRGVGGEAPSFTLWRGAGGEAGEAFSFSVCKVTHDYLKNQHFSGYTSSKFCKDARNQLSHRKIAKKSIMRARGESHLTPASASTRPRKRSGF